MYIDEKARSDPEIASRNISPASQREKSVKFAPGNIVRGSTLRRRSFICAGGMSLALAMLRVAKAQKAEPVGVVEDVRGEGFAESGNVRRPSRAGHQYEDREGARARNTADLARTRGRGDRVSGRSFEPALIDSLSEFRFGSIAENLTASISRPQRIG
jgi:hypothetical protein